MSFFILIPLKWGSLSQLFCWKNCIIYAVEKKPSEFILTVFPSPHQPATWCQDEPVSFAIWARTGRQQRRLAYIQDDLWRRGPSGGHAGTDHHLFVCSRCSQAVRAHPWAGKGHIWQGWPCGTQDTGWVNSWTILDVVFVFSLLVCFTHKTSKAPISNWFHLFTGTKIALKFVTKNKTKLKSFLREYSLTGSLSCSPFIIKVLDVLFETEDSYVFGQEYAPAGDLFDIIPPQVVLSAFLPTQSPSPPKLSRSNQPQCSETEVLTSSPGDFSAHSGFPSAQKLLLFFGPIPVDVQEVLDFKSL